MPNAIRIGDVVRDNHGREGIVVRDEPNPGTAWIEAQSDERLAALPSGERWLGVMPMIGGSVIAPASLCHRLRAAGPEDVRRAVEGANEHGVRYLVVLFPDIVRAIVEAP